MGIEYDEFAGFVGAHRLELVRLAAAMLGRAGADAEDLVQTALVRVARRWADVADPLPYARQVVARLVMDGARTRLRKPERLGLHGVEPPPVPDVGERAALADQLWRALGGLSPRQRQVLTLRYLCDCDEAETARLLDCPLGTVKSETHRALKKLRDNMNGDISV